MFEFTPYRGQVRPDHEHLRDDLVLAYTTRAQKITPKTVWLPGLFHFDGTRWQDVGQIKTYNGWRGKGYTLRLWGYQTLPSPWADILLPTEAEAVALLRHIAPFMHKENPLP